MVRRRSVVGRAAGLAGWLLAAGGLLVSLLMLAGPHQRLNVIFAACESTEATWPVREAKTPNTAWTAMGLGTARNAVPDRPPMYAGMDWKGPPMLCVVSDDAIPRSTAYRRPSARLEGPMLLGAKREVDGAPPWLVQPAAMRTLDRQSGRRLMWQQRWPQRVQANLVQRAQRLIDCKLACLDDGWPMARRGGGGGV